MPAIERRNIIFCLFDSLSAVDIGLPKAAEELPALSQIRKTGVLFSRAYAPNPEGSPARASLFTGLDPCVHGLWTNGVTLPDNERTFVQRLAQSGYSSYLAGRYQLSGVSQWTTEQTRQGEFDQTDWAHGPLHRSRQNAYLVWLQKRTPELYSQIFNDQASPENTVLQQQQRAALEALSDNLSFNYWVGQQVGQWIESQPVTKPFIAVAGFCVGDMLGTEPLPNTDGEGLLAQALKQADTAIGQLVEQVNASSYANDTVIIVTSARGNVHSADREYALAEQSIRVPLLIHGAGYAPRDLHSVVSTIDIAPTVLELANAPIGLRMQGESLLGVLNESKAPRGWALTRLRRSLKSPVPNWQTALCTSTMKLVVRHNNKLNAQEAMSLYNLDTDPLEKINLAGLETHAACLEQMIDKMIDARCALEDRTEPRIAEF